MNDWRGPCGAVCGGLASIGVIIGGKALIKPEDVQKVYTNADIPEVISIYNNWLKNKNSIVPEQLTDKSFYGYSTGYIVLSNFTDTIFGLIQRQQLSSKIFLKENGGLILC